jgi:hypothetical protein
MLMRPDQDAGLRTGSSGKALQLQTKDERMSKTAANLQSRPYQESGLKTGFSGRALQIQTRDESQIQKGSNVLPYQDVGVGTRLLAHLTEPYKSSQEMKSELVLE